jgi:hypothetical protein
VVLQALDAPADGAEVIRNDGERELRVVKVWEQHADSAGRAHPVLAVTEHAGSVSKAKVVVGGLTAAMGRLGVAEERGE